jgi:uncharacterized SAM-binding protein YcdF (DUF218 family)
MFRQLFRTVLTCGALLLLAGTAFLVALGWQINRTGARDQAQPADAIVVLGARVEADGQPGPDLQSRTLHGVRLFQQGMAPYLVCTGGYQDDKLSAASVACDLAVSQGVPADRVLLADGGMTTQEDAVSARNLAALHGFRTVILVSHPLHLERARMLFEGEGISVFPSPTSTDLAAIPWPNRVWLTVRETAGILQAGLEGLGILLPVDWTIRLGHWVYGTWATHGPGSSQQRP